MMGALGMMAELFASFFIIGMFNFGGGGAMISLIQSQVVVKHAYLTEEAFTNIVAISQSTPGPIGINCATYVGYQAIVDAGYGAAAGILGSAAATLAIVLPSFIIFLALVKFYTKYRKNPVFEGVMNILKPAVAGLIGAAAVILTLRIGWNGIVPEFSIIEENFSDWKCWTIAVIAFIASYRFKVNPIVLILCSALLGLLLF